jgi:hypothetical protein
MIPFWIANYASRSIPFETLKIVEGDVFTVITNVLAAFSICGGVGDAVHIQSVQSALAVTGQIGKCSPICGSNAMVRSEGSMMTVSWT